MYQRNSKLMEGLGSKIPSQAGYLQGYPAGFVPFHKSRLHHSASASAAQPVPAAGAAAEAAPAPAAAKQRGLELQQRLKLLAASGWAHASAAPPRC